MIVEGRFKAYLWKCTLGEDAVVKSVFEHQKLAA